MNALRKCFSALRWAFTRMPPGDALLYLLHRLLSAASGGRLRLVKYALVAQPVPAAPLIPARGTGAVQIRRVAADDALVGSFPRPAEVIRKRYADGAICFAATREAAAGEELVGFIWLMHRRYQEDEVRCWFLPEPMDQAVWDFDVYVAPEHRFGRGFSRLWDAAYAYLRGAGVRWSMSRINAFNPESLHSHARLGAVTVGSAVFLCAGARQWSWVARTSAVRTSSYEGAPVIAVSPPAIEAALLLAGEGR